MSTVVILKKHLGVIIEASPEDVRNDQYSEYTIQKTMHHVAELERYWYVIVCCMLCIYMPRLIDLSVIASQVLAGLGEDG